MGELVLPAWVAVLGPIGAALVASWGTMIVTRMKMRGSKDYYDSAAIKFLRRRLGAAGGFSFIDANTLGKKIGLTEQETVQLLFLAGFVPAREQTWIVEKE
jgi:hypothetical protein